MAYEAFVSRSTPPLRPSATPQVVEVSERSPPHAHTLAPSIYPASEPVMERLRTSSSSDVSQVMEHSLSDVVEIVDSHAQEGSGFINDMVSQLAGHLTSPGVLNDDLQEELKARLNRWGDVAVAQAVKALARKFAIQLVYQFPDLLAKQLEALPPVPQSSGEYHRHLDNFIGQNLGKVFRADEQSVRDLAKAAADKAPAIIKKFGLDREQAAELAILGLYDFAILCDNSGSMLEDNRRQALAETLRRVADIATLLSPDGISIRYLNNDGHMDAKRLDNLKTVGDIEDLMEGTVWAGNTPLGTMLNRKIVEPMVIAKARRDALKKPVIVVVITDGDANTEPPDALRDTIRNCKAALASKGYGKATAIFLISRVGNSEQARRFIDNLGRDREVGSMVFTSTADISEKQEVFKQIGDEAYTKWLIELFLAALRGQTS